MSCHIMLPSPIPWTSHYVPNKDLFHLEFITEIMRMCMCMGCQSTLHNYTFSRWFYTAAILGNPTNNYNSNSIHHCGSDSQSK